MATSSTIAENISNSALYWGIAAAVVAVLAILYAVGTPQAPSEVANSNAIAPPTGSMMTDTPPSTVPPAALPRSRGDGTNR